MCICSTLRMSTTLLNEYGMVRYVTDRVVVVVDDLYCIHVTNVHAYWHTMAYALQPIMLHRPILHFIFEPYLLTL